MNFPGSTVACPTCNAEPGARCPSVDPRNAVLRHAHRIRVGIEAEDAIGCAECHVEPGQPCIGATGVRHNRPHKSRVDVYLESWPAHTPKADTPSPVVPDAPSATSGATIENILRDLRLAWLVATGHEMTLADFDALKAVARWRGGMRTGESMAWLADTPLPDTVPPDTVPPDTVPPDTVQDGDEITPGYAPGTWTVPDWQQVPVKHQPMDRAIYELIVERAAGGRDGEVQIQPADFEAATGKQLRSVRRSINRLVTANLISTRQSRGASYYKINGVMPRWTVQVAGGMGTPPEQETVPEGDTVPPDTVPLPAGRLNQELISLSRPAGAEPTQNPATPQPPNPPATRKQRTVICVNCADGLIEYCQFGKPRGCTGIVYAAGAPPKCSLHESALARSSWPSLTKFEGVDFYHCPAQRDDRNCSALWASDVGWVNLPGLVELRPASAAAAYLAKRTG